VLKVETQRRAKGALLFIYHFAFADAQDRRVQAVSYADAPAVGPNAPVTVEYLAADPSVARIKGTRTSPVSLWPMAAIPALTLLIAAMPAVTVGWRKRWVQRLLEQGVKTQALIAQIKNGPKGSRVAVLEFNLQGVSHQAKVQVQPWGGGLAKVEALHAEAKPLAVLVNPQKPKQVMILDLLG